MVLRKVSDGDFRPFDEELKPLLARYLAGKNYVGSDYSYYAFICWFDKGVGDLRRLFYLHPPRLGGVHLPIGRFHLPFREALSRKA